MNRLAKLFVLFVSLIGLGTWGGNAIAATCTSTAAGGNWNVAGTWLAGCGAAGPVAGDIVTIATTGAGAVNVNVQASLATLTINAGSVLNIVGGGSNRIRPTGATLISGTLNILGTSTSSSRFVGLVTVNATGTWNNSGNQAVTFRGGISNGGTFTAGTGIQTFDTNAQAISGTITIPNMTVTTIAVTNNGTLTVGTALAGTGSLVNATAASILNIGGTSTITTLTATVAGNTVNYTGAAQTVKVPSGATATYYHLTLSGSGIKTMPATAMAVTGNFTMSGAVATSATAAAALTVGGNFTLNALNTFTAGAFLHSVGGNWSNSGTFTAAAGAGTVTFTGTNSTLGGTVATTFNNLTVNKTAGNNVSIVCATPSPTVNATLALTSGDIVTSGTSPGCATDCTSQVPIIVAAAGTITGGSSTSYVQGALRKMFSATGTLNFRAVAGQDEFPVGDTTNYTPIEITAGTTSTLGSVTACVTPTDHPQVTTPVTTTGIDAAKSVNRYWSLTTATITTTAAPVNAIFKFNGAFVSAGGDVDNIATTGNFIVEDYGTYWSPTTLVSPLGSSTQASNIDLTSTVSTNNDFAIGEPLSGFTSVPGRYNAFETATPAGAILGKIQTKVAGTGFSVDAVHVNATKTGVLAGAITVEVRLLDSSGGGVLDADGCNAAWPLIQALPNFNIPASGRGTIPAATVTNSYRSVRFQIRSPVGGPYTQIGCSTDLFAIRPTSLTITAHDATWATAGTGRPLANTGASGGNVHKAATSASPLPFTLRATPLPAGATNYDGNPTTVAGFPTCGTLCTTVGGLTFTAGSWTAAGSGVRENATVNYSEAGTFNLQLEDATYASVDAVDGSSAAMRTVPATASVEIGRFVPDHFDVTVLITPTFKTFNVADAACSTGSAPRRTFTYIGQPFGYLPLSAPQATIYARNAAGATTTNYQGTGASGLWKVAASDITQSYSNNAVGPSLDTTQIGTPSVTDNLNGTGTVSSAAADKLAYQRSTAAPIALFNANLSLTVSAQDATENAANQGIITSTTTALFNGTGSGIDFDGGGVSNGKEFRYGRLKIANAYGSELLNLPVPIQTQYWNSTAFVTNAADNCTILAASNINLTAPPAGVSATVGGAFSSGVGSLILTKPTTPAKAAVDMCVDLDSGVGGDTTCQATTPAAKLYLQTGTAYNKDPTARATFGVYKGNSNFIYLRENY